MKKLKIIGLTLLILMMTTTTVFATNYSSVYVTGYTGTTDATMAITGQNQYGIATINASGAFSGFIFEYCKGSQKQYKYNEPDGGTKTIRYYMSSSCTYQLYVTKDGDFPVNGEIKNYE
ncbi:hypothetical protein [Paenibacillus lutrae]|uniref:Uncharacterized protein n=1 Tax=Paenibacillus lutrae TaxID=2078573 RepID=A0A7X3K193_9BACL|nr:hypothetical protein [Paenibacillus lutrae]MVP01912.1 hypothetical protein [Paenibacillus lutrae]